MNQMRSRVASGRGREQTKARRRPRWYVRPAYALASLALVLTLLASGFGVVSASASSLPGDSLYGVKIAQEQLRLTLSLSADGDRELLARFAEERLEEAEELLAQNRFEDLPKAFEGFENNIDDLEQLTGEEDESQRVTIEHLQSRLDNHIQVLQGVIENAPEPAREALQNALEKSSHSREVLESVHGEGHPSENAPGQNKPDKDKNKEEEHPGNSGQQGRPERTGQPEKGPPPWAQND